MSDSAQENTEQVEGAEDVDPVLPQEQTPEEQRHLEIEFHGSAREYFRIWIVNLCLTIVTLGIFSAWAKVRRKRYLYSHTTLGGTPFQYLGKPIPIFKGRLIAAAGFLIYYVSSHFLTSLLPYVLLAGLVAAPWVMVRSAAFNARYSAFRNMTFHFDGSYPGALKILSPLVIIPLFSTAAAFGWQNKPIVMGVAVIALLILVVLFPWWQKGFKKFIVQHTSFGGIRGVFSARGGQFFKIYFLAFIILLAVGLPTMFTAVKFSRKYPHFLYLFMAINYIGSILAFSYVRARSGNLVWNNISIGTIRFKSSLRARDLLKLYVTNALGIIVSLGLMTPWAIMRTIKYRADTMRVLLEGELSEFKGSDLSTVSAAGAETADIFDLDFSL